MSLWLVNAAVVLVALLFLLRPLFARQSGRGPRQGDVTRGLLDNRLAELERERAVGLVGETEYTQAKLETETAYEACADDGDGQSAPRTPVAAVVVVLLSMVGAAVFYFYHSDGYRMLLVEKQATAMVEGFEEATAALERRLAETPHDPEARLLLAGSKYLVGDYAGAVAEYRRADELGALEGGDEWISYADALLRTGGAAQGERVLGGLGKILARDPGHQRALFLDGLLRFEREEYAGAVDRWRRLLTLLPPDATESREELQQLITRAQDDAAREKTENAGEAGAVTVTVSLAEALRASAEPGDTVFVYARAIEGPPMPLAVARLTVADLPAEVRLDESAAMAGGPSLNAFKQVEIVARVSRRGEALTAAGDLIGAVSPVGVGDAVSVEISDVVK